MSLTPKDSSYEAWECRFAASDILFPSITIPLSVGFVEYLQEDGVKLPLSVDSSHGDPDQEGFPEIEDSTTTAISRFGAVFPKLNWSSPVDCEWIVPDLRCRNLSDVFMVLKSSDFVAYDLERIQALRPELEDEDSPPGDRSVFPVLVLKSFRPSDLRPALEFRLFVCRRRLVAISQRHPAHYYPFLPRLVPDLRAAVSSFHKQYTRIGMLPFETYVLDVWWDMKKVWLVDVACFGPPTNPLLFEEWAFFDSDFEDGIEVRVIRGSADQRIRPTAKMGVPVEFVMGDHETAEDLGSELERIRKLVRKDS